jgi:hypothetical protein
MRCTWRVIDMKRWKPLVLRLACVLSVAAAACGGKSPEGGSPSGQGNTRVGKFKMGHGFDRAGEATRENRAFAKGETVYVSFAILDAKRDAQARVIWVAKPGVRVAEETRSLPGGDKVVTFTADTKNWEPGTYTLETWVVEPGDQGVRRLGTADFSVADSSSK